MDKAKAAVSSFLSKDGKHETTVHERVNPAIEHERIARTQQENAQEVIDREVHQHHHHTSVQPVQHKEVLPEQHHHNMIGVENREFRHGDHDHIKSKLEEEAAQFQNKRVVGDVQHTRAEAPVVAGEHVHHHVHETIQPIVQKETIQPSVVHTTIPVHEVHHNEHKHHAVSSLPAVSMADFKSRGGSLTGRDERTDAFAGEPRSVSSTLGASGSHGVLGGPGAAGTTSLTEGGRHHNTSGISEGTNDLNTSRHNDHVPVGTVGNDSSRVANAADSRNPSDTIGSRDSTTGITGTHNNTNMNGSTSTTGINDPAVKKKGGLMGKLNPKVDSDGDGKAGIMK